jgi:phosphoribosylanthranilate isomerase
MIVPRAAAPAVKVCGLTDPAQARACAEAGAWGIGVVLADSPRRVEARRAREVLEALPASIARVGVFVDPDPARAAAMVAALGLTHVQVHGHSDVEAIRRATGRPVIEGVRVHGEEAVAVARASRADLVLVDAAVPGAHGGTGTTFDWDLLGPGGAALGRPFALAGGLTPDNVGEALRRLAPALVDVSSGVESAPGQKDIRRVREFLRAVTMVGVRG